MTTEESKIDISILSSWLEKKKPVTVLDVRPKTEREEWSIPGSVHADVYDKLKAGDTNALDHIELNIGIPVVTVCAAGKTSLKAAELLKDKGFEVYSLEGGMKAWNFAWSTAEVVLNDVKIIQIRRSSKGVLSYIIGSDDEAIVIDAALDSHVYLDLANKNGWTIKYVTDTHIHADYLSRTRELAKASIATHVLIDAANVEYGYSPVSNGDYLHFGKAALEVIYTPGHTMESTSFRLGDDAIFTGDTLFVDGVGRPDLKADQDEAIKRSRLLYASLQRLLTLNPKTFVLPAHLATAVPFDGKLISETIENLKDKLDMLKLKESEFVKYTTSRIPPTPPNYLTIASLNKQGSYDGHIPADLEAGANRCAIA
ncbi:MAG: MBL fold metallo-hydrolase [Bacteroidetes bacterium]|jgi:glyoxylase-like metal-dependent hydrolase (beta-lactamase superfamily II)/rhodanese-related sulfurtransferase|nr:MBL fold metallo-hydrolase [Bacteroidota bacterium]